MGSIGCSETSVINYHLSLRNNLEESSSHLVRGGSLKSRRGRKDLRGPNVDGRMSGSYLYRVRKFRAGSCDKVDESEVSW